LIKVVSIIVACNVGTSLHYLCNVINASVLKIFYHCIFQQLARPLNLYILTSPPHDCFEHLESILHFLGVRETFKFRRFFTVLQERFET